MSARLILWDFDGTLADTLPLALAAYNRLALEQGFRTATDPGQARRMTIREFLSEHGIPAWRVPGLFSRFLSEMSGSIRSAVLFEGITDVLEALRQDQRRHIVISSNSTDNIRECLQRQSADSLFESVLGTSRLFGKERQIRRAIRDFNVAADECLYIGDEVRDIEAARAAGVPVGCVALGLNAAETLQQHDPAFLAESPEQLPALVRALNR